jgi:hypothetical protein
VYGIVSEFLKFRENFLDVYKNLFGEAEEELTAEDKAAMEPDEIKEVEKEVKNKQVVLGTYDLWPYRWGYNQNRSCRSSTSYLCVQYVRDEKRARHLTDTPQ